MSRGVHDTETSSSSRHESAQTDWRGQIFVHARRFDTQGTPIGAATFVVEGVGSESTVDDIQRKLHACNPIPTGLWNEFVALFAGRVLEDGVPLREYGIKPHSTVATFFRLRGGGANEVEEARHYLNHLQALTTLTEDQTTIQRLVLTFGLSESDAIALIQEIRYGKDGPPPSRVDRLQEVGNVFPDEFGDFLKDSDQKLPCTLTEWTALDALLERLMEHTIHTISKWENMARVYRWSYGSDGRQRPTHLRHLSKHNSVKETVILSNLTVSTKGPIIAALLGLGIEPFLKGKQAADCDFTSGSEALVNGKIRYGTGTAAFTFYRTVAAESKCKEIYMGTKPLVIVGQHSSPTVHVCRKDYDSKQAKVTLEPPTEADASMYTFVFALAGIYGSEADILAAMTFLLQKESLILDAAEIYTDQSGKCASNVMHQSVDRHRYGNRLALGLSSRRETLREVTNRVLQAHEGLKFTCRLFNAYLTDQEVPADLIPFRGCSGFELRIMRSTRMTEREFKCMVSISMRIGHFDVRNAMAALLREGTGSSALAVEEVIEERIGQLLTYCLSQFLTAGELETLIGSMEVEVTTQRSEITERSLIILMFQNQNTFPLELVRFWALQIAVLVAMRSKNPEHAELHYCPLTNYKLQGGRGSLDLDRAQACSVLAVTTRGAASEERIQYNITTTRNSSEESAGTIGTVTAGRDPLIVTIIKTLRGMKTGSTVSNGTALALATLRITDRASRPSMACKTLMARPTQAPGVRNMVHLAAAAHADQHDGSASSSRWGEQREAQFHTPLAVLQTQVKGALTGHRGGCDAIGKTMADILLNAKDDMDANLNHDLLYQALSSALVLWASTAVLPDASFVTAVCKIRPAVTPDSTSSPRPGLTHRLFMGIMETFMQCDRQCSESAVTTVTLRLLWEHVALDPKAQRIPELMTLITVIYLAESCQEKAMPTMVGLAQECHRRAEALHEPPSCAWCHMPNDALQEKTMATTTGNGQGGVAMLCAACHSGTGSGAPVNRTADHATRSPPPSGGGDAI